MLVKTDSVGLDSNAIVYVQPEPPRSYLLRMVRGQSVITANLSVLCSL